MAATGQIGEYPSTETTIRPVQLTFHAYVHLAVLFLFIVVITLQVPLQQPLIDAFQEAEYVTFGFLAHTQPNFHMPVLIHGAMDIVPSKLAAIACRADSQVVCVRAMSMLIQLTTAGLFGAVLAMVAGVGTAASLLASLPALAMLWLYDGTTVEIVDSHGSIPGIRDLFMMAGLLIMVGLCQRIGRGKALSTPFLLILGCLAGVGLFWAYNRGLALALVAGAFGVALSVINRSLRPILLLALGGAIGLAAVLAAGGVHIVPDTLFNISYWSHNQAIWHTPLRLRVAAPLAALSAIVLIGAVLVAWQSLKAGRLGRVLLLGVLAAVYVLYTFQSLNRSDIPHMREIIWPAALILAVVIREWIDRTDPLPARSGGLPLLVLLVIVGGFIEFFSRSSALQTIETGLVENARLLIKGLPTDRALVDSDMNRVADLVAASGHCTFAASNAGIVYLLSRVQPCSRFPFGVYVAADRQAEVIKELEDTSPQIILWDSSKWYSHIDELSFHDRTPILADWIESHYPIRTVIGQQTVVSRTELDKNVTSPPALR